MRYTIVLIYPMVTHRLKQAHLKFWVSLENENKNNLQPQFEK